MRRLAGCLVLLALGALLSGCIGGTGWQGYGSITGYVYVSDCVPSCPSPSVHLGTSPPDGFRPWAFATVEVLGTSRVATTDSYGGFTLSGVPEGSRTLVVRDADFEWHTSYYQPASSLVFGSPPDSRSWTVMVYMIGDNTLGLSGSNYLLDDINEMEEAYYDSEEISVLAFADPLVEWASSGQSSYSEPSGYVGARVYEIRRDLAQSDSLVSPVVASPRDSSSAIQTDSVDPQVLRSFVRWCTIMYPAQNYALILWDHGDGIAIHDEFRIKSIEAKAIGPDQDGDTRVGGRFINVNQIAEALSDLGVDLIGFDACLMGGVEVAYELRGCAEVVVASQEMIPAAGWNYTEVLGNLNSGYGPWEYGVALVDSYAGVYSGYSGQFPAALTCSAVNTSELDQLIERFDLLSGTLKQALDDPVTQNSVRDGILSTLTSTTRFGYDSSRPLRYDYHYYDLEHLCRELAAASSEWGLPPTQAEIIEQQAGLILEWFEWPAYRVYSEAVPGLVGEGWGSACGLSIYCGPSDSWDADNPGYNYDQCEFAQDTGWFGVLSLLGRSQER